jgi:hypothetical protein
MFIDGRSTCGASGRKVLSTVPRHYSSIIPDVVDFRKTRDRLKCETNSAEYFRKSRK